MSVQHKVDSVKDHAEKRQQAEALSSAAEIAFVVLAEAEHIDAVTATEHASLFSEWTHPVGYAVGQIRRYNGKLYRCVTAHTSQADWTPDAAASLWAVTGDPAVEWPDWSQPLGAHDAYNVGDKVTHGGKHWISSTAANVWEPGVYGWTEAV